MAITFTYTSSNPSYPSGTQTFTSASNLRSFITNTLDKTKLTTAVVSGNVTGSIADLFSGCNTMTSCDCSGLDVSSVTAMYNMFYGTSKMKNLDVSTWDTGNCTMFHSMFSSVGLTEIDISNFDLSKATTINSMFAWSGSLTTIYCNDDWAIKYNITSANTVFSGCGKLKGAISYDGSKVGIAQCNPTNGYFTRKQTTKPIYFNGTQLEHVYFNGNELEHLYFNGNQLF